MRSVSPDGALPTYERRELYRADGRKLNPDFGSKPLLSLVENS